MAFNWSQDFQLGVGSSGHKWYCTVRYIHIDFRSSYCSCHLVCLYSLPLGIRPVPWQVGQWTVSPELCLLLEVHFLIPSSSIICWLSSWPLPLWCNPVPPVPPSHLLEMVPIPEETRIIFETSYLQNVDELLGGKSLLREN